MITSKKIIICDECGLEDVFPSNDIWFEIIVLHFDVRNKKKIRKKIHSCSCQSCSNTIVGGYLNKMDADGDSVSLEIKVI